MSFPFSHEEQVKEFACTLIGTAVTTESVWSGEWPDGVWLKPAIILELVSWRGRVLNPNLVPWPWQWKEEGICKKIMM